MKFGDCCSKSTKRRSFWMLYSVARWITPESEVSLRDTISEQRLTLFKRDIRRRYSKHGRQRECRTADYCFNKSVPKKAKTVPRWSPFFSDSQSVIFDYLEKSKTGCTKLLALFDAGHAEKRSRKKSGLSPKSASVNTFATAAAEIGRRRLRIAAPHPSYSLGSAFCLKASKRSLAGGNSG